MAPNSEYRHQGRVLSDRYEVDERLLQLGMTRDFAITCAFQGDLERRSTPAFAFDGHDEYVANSWIRHAMCEHGGETDGGWHPGHHHGIPVAFNHNHTIAINPTAGSEGTGQPHGAPVNRSSKGPWTRKAAEESAATPLFLPEEFDQVPVDFWWFFTRRDDDGLWAELFAPVIEDGGHASGWTERVLFGNIGGNGGPGRIAPLPAPAPAPDITIARRSA